MSPLKNQGHNPKTWPKHRVVCGLAGHQSNAGVSRQHPSSCPQRLRIFQPRYREKAGSASGAGPGIYTSVVCKLWIPAVDSVSLISFLSLCVFGQLTLTSLDSRLLKRDDSMNLSGSL